MIDDRIGNLFVARILFFHSLNLLAEAAQFLLNALHPNFHFLRVARAISAAPFLTTGRAAFARAIAARWTVAATRRRARTALAIRTACTARACSIGAGAARATGSARPCPVTSSWRAPFRSSFFLWNLLSQFADLLRLLWKACSFEHFSRSSHIAHPITTWAASTSFRPTSFWPAAISARSTRTPTFRSAGTTSLRPSFRSTSTVWAALAVRAAAMCFHRFLHHRASFLSQCFRFGVVASFLGLVNLLAKLLHFLARLGNFFIARTAGTARSTERVARHLGLKLLAHLIELLAYLSCFHFLARLFQLAHLAMQLCRFFKLLAKLPHFFRVEALPAGTARRRSITGRSMIGRRVSGRRAGTGRRTSGASFSRRRTTFTSRRPIGQARFGLGTILSIRHSQYLARLLGQFAGLSLIPIGGLSFCPLKELTRLLGRIFR